GRKSLSFSKSVELHDKVIVDLPLYFQTPVIT
ncbi:IS1 family transposase, partial [Escherichia coli]